MICLFCKKEIIAPPRSRIGRKYCSDFCKIKIKERSKTCPACNKFFIYLIKYNKERIYCSNKCSASEINKKRYLSPAYKRMTEEEARVRLKNILEKYTNKTISCWLWTGIKSKDGYGKIKWKNKHMFAHRASYLLYYNELPNNLCVCHTCDKPECINPRHLFLGTNKDNMQDMIKKGRSNYVKHDKHPMKKITMEVAKQIRLALKEKTSTAKEISKKYNLTIDHILNIKKE